VAIAVASAAARVEPAVVHVVRVAAVAAASVVGAARYASTAPTTSATLITRISLAFDAMSVSVARSSPDASWEPVRGTSVL
jgi:hypothetical protein